MVLDLTDDIYFKDGNTSVYATYSAIFTIENDKLIINDDKYIKIKNEDINLKERKVGCYVEGDFLYLETYLESERVAFFQQIRLF